VFEIQRLKEKVGNRSNASSEIEYRGTWARPVGAPGRGIATLIEMAHHTRFDIVVGVAGMMRAALDHALHHAMHRSAFGHTLVAQPLMANVLADLALEAEAALIVAFRLAQAFDASAANEDERELQRILTPVAKYWLCKRMTPVATEAMECLGGNGYVEESAPARLYREAPLNGIWEGSANVISLDALRAIALADRAAQMLRAGEAAERDARAIVEALALAVQASLMKRHSDARAAEAFCRSRLAAAHACGTLDSGIDTAALLRRAARE
jgi:putative acyl-CoA dehydrogenase